MYLYRIYSPAPLYTWHIPTREGLRLMGFENDIVRHDRWNLRLWNTPLQEISDEDEAAGPVKVLADPANVKKVVKGDNFDAVPIPRPLTCRRCNSLGKAFVRRHVSALYIF